jgi:membrane protein DedA with SNARE-associated domain
MDTIEGLLDTWGYLALFLGTFLEGETILILAGIAASKGIMDVNLSVLAAFLGSFLGDQTVFYLSRYKSVWVLNKFTKIQNKIDRALTILEKYSVWILLTFRFFYGFRNVVSVAAGLSKVTRTKFAIYNGIGALVWALVFGYGGLYLGKALINYIEGAKQYQVYVLIGLGLITVLFLIISKVRSYKK